MYRSDRFRDAFIYHAGLGIYARHEDFTKREGDRNAIEWVYSPYAIALGKNIRTESIYYPLPGHSTCTASNAAVYLYGASRNTTLVIVKMPDYSTETVTEILATIDEHIKQHDREFLSVISIFWGFDGRVDPNNLGSVWEQVYSYMKAISPKVLIICAAGNDALDVSSTSKRMRVVVDTAPTIWAQKGPFTNILAVGNVNFDGQRYRESQVAGSYQMHAPSVNITYATAMTTTDTHKDTGTSYCKTPCYLMSMSMLVD